MIEIVDPDDPSRVVEYGAPGRVRLTTMTREFFMPRFLERDQAERERPCELYPWTASATYGRSRRWARRSSKGSIDGARTHPAPRPAYRSLDVAVVPHYRTREPLVEISQANVGLIRRDLLRQADARDALARRPVRELIDICGRAADHFMRDPLPLDPDGAAQTPDDYVRHLTGRRVCRTCSCAATCRRSGRAGRDGAGARRADPAPGPVRLDDGVAAAKAVPQLLPAGAVAGDRAAQQLARGPHAVGARGGDEGPARASSGQCRAVDAAADGPGADAAGCPPEAFSYYPSAHGASERFSAARDAACSSATRRRPRPGGVTRTSSCMDPASARSSSGRTAWTAGRSSSTRSCGPSSRTAVGRASTPRASGRRVTATRLPTRWPPASPRSFPARKTTSARSWRRLRIRRRPAYLRHRGWRPARARRPGGHGGSATGRAPGHPRRLHLPAADHRPVRAEHVLANREFLFPFASVVEVPQAVLPGALGQTLVVSAITEDPLLIRRLVDSPLVDRLNIGPIPTNRLTWDQPHEGNLFDHLYGAARVPAPFSGRVG